MGAQGNYEFIRHNGLIGAVMPKPDERPGSLWSYYFRVANIDLAVEAIGTSGGALVMGPEEIPGGDFIVIGIDPQGALFSLIGTRPAQS